MTHYTLTINDQLFEVEIGAIQGDTAHVIVNEAPYQVKIDGAGRPVSPLSSAPLASMPTPTAPKSALCAIVGSGVVAAPIPGKILYIEVGVGDRVKNGQTVAIMEAMKMENNILSPVDGVVKEIRAVTGTDVGTGDVIMVIA